MEKKLHYFNINGFAEPIRYMLHYAGEKFEDTRYDWSKWPIKSVKDSLPYGKMPIYEEGDRKLDQSLAIARYIASQANLLPKDPWEQAVLDAVVLTIYDLYGKFAPYFEEKDPEKKQALKQELLEEQVVFFFSRFERELKDSNGHFGGNVLTWADFVLVGAVELCNMVFGVKTEKNYPTMQALIQKIRALPGIQEYIATRKPYVLKE